MFFFLRFSMVFLWKKVGVIMCYSCSHMFSSGFVVFVV